MVDLGACVERLAPQVDVHGPGQRVRHHQRRRGQVVHLHVRVDPALEVPVAGQHRDDRQVVVGDRMLVVAPHPDDETLAAGIAIGPWGLKVVGNVQDIRAFAEQIRAYRAAWAEAGHHRLPPGIHLDLVADWLTDQARSRDYIV